MSFENCVLGIELGSTRIKAVLVDENRKPVASGSYAWENRLEKGIWTYHLSDIHFGLHACFADLVKNAGEPIETLAAIGVSAMMHGYLPFDENGYLLTGFRTWRNTMTSQAAEKLSDLFGFNIPERWSIAHLCQAMLNKEEHVAHIAHLTTLAGYVQYRLGGGYRLGIGDASGMFPIDPKTLQYDEEMLAKFDKLAAEAGYSWKTKDLLPEILLAGQQAGVLSEEGARFLDPTGGLKAGIPLAPCEGDAGTGMVATNSVREKTGNVSAGTSSFAMIVTSRQLGVHKEIDMVTTPDGKPVAMVHCNNCTSDIDAWVNLFADFAASIGSPMEKDDLYSLLFAKALEGDKDCQGLMSFNYYSGESITGLEKGRPLFTRLPEVQMTLATFMRTHMMSALATLKIGLDILCEQENVEIDRIYGHGGYFKTPLVGQQMLSAAINSPVAVMETAGEGGPYGMALLADYMVHRQENESLADYLENKVFAKAKSTEIMSSKEDVEGFAAFLQRYKEALSLEEKATEVI